MVTAIWWFVLFGMDGRLVKAAKRDLEEALAPKTRLHVVADQGRVEGAKTPLIAQEAEARNGGVAKDGITGFTPVELDPKMQMAKADEAERLKRSFISIATSLGASVVEARIEAERGKIEAEGRTIRALMEQFENNQAADGLMRSEQ
jgi:hypothetical protein